MGVTSTDYESKRCSVLRITFDGKNPGSRDNGLDWRRSRWTLKHTRPHLGGHAWSALCCLRVKWTGLGDCQSQVLGDR